MEENQTFSEVLKEHQIFLFQKKCHQVSLKGTQAVILIKKKQVSQYET
jgi:hypothetical protein